jgi:hypothetical protein
MSAMFKISTITKLITEIDDHWRKELVVFDNNTDTLYGRMPNILDKCIKELEDLKELQKLNYLKRIEEESKKLLTNPCIKCKIVGGHTYFDEDLEIEIDEDLVGDFEIKIDEDLIKMCGSCWHHWKNVNRPRPKEKVSIKDFIDPKNKKQMEQYRTY